MSSSFGYVKNLHLPPTLKKILSRAHCSKSCITMWKWRIRPHASYHANIEHYHFIPAGRLYCRLTIYPALSCTPWGVRNKYIESSAFQFIVTSSGDKAPSTAAGSDSLIQKKMKVSLTGPQEGFLGAEGFQLSTVEAELSLKMGPWRRANQNSRSQEHKSLTSWGQWRAEIQPWADPFCLHSLCAITSNPLTCRSKLFSLVEGTITSFTELFKSRI